MKFSTVTAYLVMSAMMCGVSNVSAMNKKNEEFKKALNTFYSTGGCVPPMANTPRSQLTKSNENGCYSCIPSAARCSCVSSSSNQSKNNNEDIKQNEKLGKLAAEKKDEERRKALEQVKDAFKNLVKNFGKTEAIGIIQEAVDESSDSDTESSASASTGGSVRSLSLQGKKDPFKNNEKE